MREKLIKQVTLDNRTVDILIEGNRFERIADHIEAPNAAIVEGGGKAILPPFYNAHTHAGMTLFRGFADDIGLFEWLENHIWPAEKNLTREDVESATRLAIVEMIRGGTIFFNDMYWEPAAVARVAEEMGVRAAIGRLFIEERPGKVRPVCQRASEELEAMRPQLPERIQTTYAPHAIYTVSEITLRRIGEAAAHTGEMIHIHAAETRTEYEQCMEEHGCSPIVWLDKCGILGPRTVLAHCVHLSDADIALIKERGCTVAHMPVSNAKLGSGRFDFKRVVEEARCRTTIGTDGCASNNSLSMFDEMKWAALSAKLQDATPTSGDAKTIFDCATRTGAEVFGVEGGSIAVGKVADAILIDLAAPMLTPCYQLTANLVYSADSSVVDTVICDGRILMRNRLIPGEEEVVAAMREVVAKYKPWSR